MSFELPPKQSGPSAWMGSDLADDYSWVWQLTQSEIRSVLGRRMDSAVLDKVEGLRSELIDGRGFRLIRGLPAYRLELTAQ